MFASDALSSTAYATEEILFVTAVGGSSLALGLSRLVPISIVVAILLTLVVTSYRQTIFAYPGGGGSYMVSRDNLGRYPSLVAGASLLVDYILTVAVSISAGVAAIISLPAFHGLDDQRVLLGLGLIALITLANLRGLKESGTLFAVPTYIYIVSIGGLVLYGLYRVYFGHIDPVPFDPERAQDIQQVGGSLGLFLLLKGFSSGAVALTGVEAIADGVPAFRKPEAKNAATTIVMMAVILGTLFFGVSVLAHHLAPYPNEVETVISQMGRAVFGERLPLRRAAGRHGRHPDARGQHRLRRLPPSLLDHRPRRLPAPPVRQPRRPARLLQRRRVPRRSPPAGSSSPSAASPTR